jgi:hypothetical protein
VHNYSHYASHPHPYEEIRRLGASRHAACVEAHSPTPDLHEVLEIAALMRRSARVALLLLVPTSTVPLSNPDPSLISYPSRSPIYPPPRP